MEELCMVYITASAREEGIKIAKELIFSKLAACANVIGKAVSVYEWEGRLHEDEEFVIILKTKTALFPDIEKLVKTLHTYSCPCIVSIPIINASEDFAKWIEDRTTG